jgi:2-polyprenyl-6-methoxyphenol hydroxylase-like FAD-dependent oxidoreductase
VACPLASIRCVPGILARHDADHRAAFATYERRQRPYSDAAQDFTVGGADLMGPATQADIEWRNARLRLVPTQ